MVVVETDLILALASKTDKHHSDAVRIVKNIRPLTISPYVFIEVDFLIRLGMLKVVQPDFYKALKQLIEFYEISVAKVRPEHVMIARDLRERYGLTYFDSLHAAVAITEDDVLLSYNKIYSKISGIRYLHPEQMLKSTTYH